MISNFDEDHICDYPDLVQACDVRSCKWNYRVSREQLMSMKTTPYSHALITLADRIDVASPGGYTADLEGVTKTYFYNGYGAFRDTNNVSVVTFVTYMGHKFCFPGDLQCDGWLELLRKDAFKAELRDVTVFMASHHGRDNGRCEQVFDFCSPLIAIISDRNNL